MKDELRSQFIITRKGITEKRRMIANAKVFEALTKMVLESQNVLSYYPLEDEVCVLAFNKFLATQNRLSLPRIEEGTLVPYEVSDMEKQLKTFSHRFLEPDFICKQAEKIDLVIVPGIVFDNNGGRIGFGKGFYDKFLKKTSIPTIGLCFEEQIYDGNLPLETHDISMEKLCIV
ncbi:MAG: hypothetical protein S4CHLAM20_05480 [Chlamydiia bacterium]|nr:hypothetical protein [Chlamydiia bacterium]